MLAACALAVLALDPAARLDAFLKAHPAFVAVTELSVNDKAVGRSTFRVQRDAARLRFDAKGAGYDYTLSETERGYLEVERVEKVYDEHPPIGGLALYESDLAGALALAPKYLLVDSADKMMGGQKATATGDELRANFQTQDGPVELRLLVGPDGSPQRFTSNAGGRTQSWKTVSFVSGTGTLPEYRIEVPLGFVPHRLPPLPTPLAIGSPAPLSGWQRLGKPLDLGVASPGKPRLLAVLGDDCAPSRAAKPFLVELGKSMPVFLIGKGEITDPAGGKLKLLSPPGTPMFYLVGGDGKVKNLWFGFDAAGGRAWEKEVLEAAQGAAK